MQNNPKTSRFFISKKTKQKMMLFYSNKQINKVSIVRDHSKIISTTMDNSIIRYYYHKIKQSYYILNVIMNYFNIIPYQWHKYSFSKQKKMRWKIVLTDSTLAAIASK